MSDLTITEEVVLRNAIAEALAPFHPEGPVPYRLPDRVAWVTTALSARVADLEAQLATATEEQSRAWAVLTGEHWMAGRPEGSLVAAATAMRDRLAGETARADTAEAVGCGSSSCRFAKQRDGLRDNGPCRCAKLSESVAKLNETCESLLADLEAVRAIASKALGKQDAGGRESHLVGLALDALRDDLARVTGERDRNEREVQRLMNVVCSAPACSAAIVRRDDGSRVCAAGHPARWVNVDLLTKAEADLAAARQEAEALRALIGRASDYGENGGWERISPFADEMRDAAMSAPPPAPVPAGTFRCPTCDRAYPHSVAEHAICAGCGLFAETMVDTRWRGADPRASAPPPLTDAEMKEWARQGAEYAAGPGKRLCRYTTDRCTLPSPAPDMEPEGETRDCPDCNGTTFTASGNDCATCDGTGVRAGFAPKIDRALDALAVLREDDAPRQDASKQGT